MSKKFLFKVVKWIDWLDRTLSWAWWLYLGVFLLVTFEVLMRYVFYSSHDWGEEVIIAATLWATLLATGRATKEGRHISLEFFNTRLRGKWRRISNIINSLIVMVVSGIMSVFVFQWGLFLDRMGMTQASTLGMPLSVIAYALFAGMALNAIFSFRTFLQAFLGISSDKEADEELEATYVKY